MEHEGVFTPRLDVEDARTVRRAGARFASDLAGAAWATFVMALAEQGERLRRAVTAAGYGSEQARLAAARFEAAARDERAWIDAATDTGSGVENGRRVADRAVFGEAR